VFFLFAASAVAIGAYAGHPLPVSPTFLPREKAQKKESQWLSS
jgi:hypothetical protein